MSTAGNVRVHHKVQGYKADSVNLNHHGFKVDTRKTKGFFVLFETKSSNKIDQSEEFYEKEEIHCGCKK